MATIRPFNLSGSVDMLRIAQHVVRTYPGSAYQGLGAISDFVSRAGVLGVYRVYLLDRETGELVERTVSAPDGSYSFPHLRVIPDGYLVVAVDNDPKADALNAAVADLITPGVP